MSKDSSHISKKHHYLPEFYTKRWAGEDGRICQFSKPYGRAKPRRVHPAATGYVTRLYAMKGLPDQLEDQFERLFLRPADSKAADVLTVLEAGGKHFKWTSKERSAWTRFILSLLLRMPEDVENLKALVKAGLAKPDPETESRYLALKSQDDPPTMAEWLQKNDPHFAENSTFRVAMRLIDNPTIGEDINGFNWFTLRTAPTFYEFLTSDRPVVMTPSLGGRGAGFAFAYRASPSVCGHP